MTCDAMLRRWLRAGAEQLPEPVLTRLVMALEVGERMTLAEHPEPRAATGLVLSNWEI